MGLVAAHGGEWQHGDRRAAERTLVATLQRQAVAPPRDGGQDCMPLVTERSPDLVDALNETVVSNGGASPDGFKQLGLADQPVRVLGEVAKDRKGLRPEGDCVAVAKTKQLAFQIDDNLVVEDKGGSCWRTDHDDPLV